MNIRASDVIREFSRDREELDSHHGRVRRVSDRPLIAVGVIGSEVTPYLLVLPEGAIRREVFGDYLRVKPSSELSLMDAQTGEKFIARATSVMFRSVNPASLRFLDLLVESLLSPGGMEQVDSLTAGFIDLFSSKKGLSRDEVVGLFGELLVIDQASNSEQMALAWHKKNQDAFDFARDNERVEVKTSLGNHRHHTFSSSQIPPPDGTVANVVSILTAEVEGGEGVVDLFAGLDNKIKSSAELNGFRMKVLNFLGRDYEQCSALKFDFEMACASLAIYDIRSLPHLHLPAEVVRANWTVNMELVPELAAEQRNLPETLVQFLGRE